MMTPECVDSDGECFELRGIRTEGPYGVVERFDRGPITLGATPSPR